MKKALLTITVLLSAIAGVFAYSNHASAADLSQFHAGRIIDDSIFTENQSMSVGQIQEFLNQKSSACLRDFRSLSLHDDNGDGIVQDSTTEQYGPGTMSAAELIKAASDIYRINPKVILVTLQKEQGLITRQDCPAWRYNTALGYGCPDTADCDQAAFGFTRQIDYGAYHFRGFFDDSLSSVPFGTGPHTIAYNPNGSCGSSVVNIENRATAALYSYTPYQPNAAALAAGYGEAPPCGAYGNRNFYNYFTDWFGSTVRPFGTITQTSSLTLNKPISVAIGDDVTGSYTISNNASYAISAGGFGVCARLNGINYDFGFENSVTIPGNGSATISKTKRIDRPGILTAFVCSYNEALGGWASERYPYPASGSIVRSTSVETVNNPLITTGLNLSPASPVLHQPVTATFTVQNRSSNPVIIPVLGVAARDPQGNNVGYPGETNVVVPANGTYTYSKTRTFTGNPGDHRFFVTSFRNNIWDDNYPLSAGGVARTKTVRVNDNPVISTSVSISPANAGLGQPVTASFTIQNSSPNPITIPLIAIAARDPHGANVGYPGETNVVVPANGTYTYSKSRTFTSNPGTYRFFITSFRNNTWDDNYPSSLDGVARNVTAKVYDNPVITTGLSLSPTNPTLGQSVTASFTLQNRSSNPITIPVLAVAARDPNGANVGYPGETNVVVPANGSYTYSKTRTFTGPGGTYRFFVTSFRNNTWDDNYPFNVDGIARSLNISIH